MKLKCSAKSVVICTSKGAINTRNTLTTIETVPGIQYSTVATHVMINFKSFAVCWSFLRHLFYSCCQSSLTINQGSQIHPGTKNVAGACTKDKTDVPGRIPN